MKRWLLVLLIACGKSESTETPKPETPKPETQRPETPKSAPKQPDPKPAPNPEPKQPDPKPAANAQPGLTATMDGKPLAVHSVLAANDSDGQVRLHLYNFEVTCDQLTKGWTRPDQLTDLDLTLRIGRFIHADGTLGSAIRGWYWHPKREGGSTTIQTEKEDGGEPFPPATVVDGTAGKTFEVPLAIEMKSSDEKDPRSLSIKGTAKVVGCGDEKLKRDTPRPSPQPGAFIVLAKQKVPISGAAFIVKKDGSRTLEIATHDVVCVEGSDHTASKWPDVEVEITWNKAGKLESIAMGGAWVAHHGNGEPGKLAVSPNMARGKDAMFTFGGETKLGDYSLALEGKVKAIVCPTAK